MTFKLTILRITLIISSIFLSMAQVQAQSNNTHFIELQSVHIYHSDFNSDAGFGVAFSYSFNENWYGVGSYARNEVSFDIANDIGYINYFVGAGYRWQFDHQNEVYLQVSAEIQQLSSNEVKIDARGASVEFGDQITLNEKWVLVLHTRLSDINISKDTDRHFELYAGVRAD